MWFELIEKIIKYLILFLIGVLLFIVIHKVYKKCIDGFSISAQPNVNSTDIYIMDNSGIRGDTLNFDKSEPVSATAGHTKLDLSPT